MTAGQIPRGIIERILAFLARRPTGSITLHCDKGRIVRVAFNEVVKVSDDVLDCT